MRQADVWTPVLMLTAKDGEYDQADAFDLGADDYLIKPFHFVVLVARLRALARRGTQARPTELVVGPIRLDPASHQVWRGEEALDLTAKQFSLLLYFMRNEGVVLSKAQILDNVWGEDFEGNENIVEVYVRKIRQKIDVPYGSELLTTIRGAGYRLAARGA
ncbi:response regulator transcription factor [Trueperella pecoris]|uniref:response regulator transcription factor n=1 Tax=Trueperella pecoris TaxID=2733571 RepID=UPI001C20C662|nr:response regulator transcription factor [Trueperella pecoris]